MLLPHYKTYMSLLKFLSLLLLKTKYVNVFIVAKILYCPHSHISESAQSNFTASVCIRVHWMRFIYMYYTANTETKKDQGSFRRVMI